MQIVIDISKDRYDEIMSMDWKNGRRFFDEEIRAIHDGKALEQEPCDDCVRREEVIKTISEWFFSKEFHYTNAAEYLRNRLDELPSVTPQQKMGRWKAFTHSAYRGNDEDGEPIWREVTVYHCDLCNRRTVIKEKYCPNCGCKMQEVEE